MTKEQSPVLKTETRIPDPPRPPGPVPTPGQLARALLRQIKPKKAKS